MTQTTLTPEAGTAPANTKVEGRAETSKRAPMRPAHPLWG